MRTPERILRDALWLQLDIRSAEARRVALASGMDYVEDERTLIVRRRDLG